MKIIRGDKTYIQVRDLEAILRLGYAVPFEIMEKLMEYNMGYTDKNRPEFIDVSGDAVRFFLDYDTPFIQDMDKTLAMSDEGLQVIANAASKARNKEVFGQIERYIISDEQEKEAYRNNHRFQDLKEIFFIKKGVSELHFPEGIEPLEKKDTSKQKTMETPYTFE